MIVWKMNLIDNRDNVSVDQKKLKFNFCIKKSIVGIGWVGYDTNGESNDAYTKAKNAILSFEVGDFVWVKSELGIYFVCKITQKAKYCGDEYGEYDIGYCCKCKFVLIGNENKLPNGISKSSLVSISTVSSCDKTVSDITKKYFSNKNKQITTITLIGIVIGIIAIVLIACLDTSSNTKSYKSEDKNYSYGGYDYNDLPEKNKDHLRQLEEWREKNIR